jgi:hypothetical protein
MDVVDHSPHFWFLLRDGDDLLLDMNCSQGAYGFSLLLMLSEREREDFEKSGRTALDALATAVQDSAPMAQHSTSPYRTRDLEPIRGGEVVEAVERWRSEHP